MPYQLDGKTLKPGEPFETADGTQYPGNWLALSTDKQREAIGIVWVEPASEPYYDQRFYWGPDNPKDLGSLKVTWVGKQRDTAYSLLAPTDWMVIREIENPARSMSARETAGRADIRAVCDEREQQIRDCSTTDELATLINEQGLVPWPGERVSPEPEPTPEPTPEPEPDPPFSPGSSSSTIN